MVSKSVLLTCNAIKSLKIQGARNIAKAAVKALAHQAKSSRARNASEFISELLEAADILASSRPTEPMLRNSLRKALRFVFFRLNLENTEDISVLKERMEHEAREFESNMRRNSERIAEIGSKLIPKNSVVLTHCHSSTVTAILIRASETRGIKQVVCTETRPLLQGRITAKELHNAGIKCTLIADSAVRASIAEFRPAVVIVGSDAISVSGELINKIGTSQIAELANSRGIPFYCAAEIYKFDPATIWGKMEDIEARPKEELLSTLKPSSSLKGSFFGGIKLKGVDAFNPAFDRTEAKLITSYITELGIFPPQSLSGIVSSELGIKNPI
ncbi:MAG: S-methyl-5-thioribose-1-phosphate isomerase [Candidatus Anstonellales archaeon]